MTWNDLQQARNDLKRPITSKKWPETIYNNLQRARNNLKWPTTSITQPTMTWTYLQQRKDAKWLTTSRFSDYFTIWGKWFSSLTHFPPNIWLYSFKHCFTENHGENRASCIDHHASSVTYHVYFFMGYKIYFFLSEFHVQRESERLLF